MINIKNCFLIVMCIMSIYHVTISAQGCPCASDLKEIQKAVNGEAKAIDNKIVTPQADSVVSALSKIFVLQPKTKVGDSGQSILDAKIDLYANNFYKWYGKDAFGAVDIDKNKQTRATSNKDFFNKYGQESLKENYEAVDKEVNKAVQQYIDKSLGKQPVTPRTNSVNQSIESESDAKKNLLKQTNDYIQGVNNKSYPAMLNPLKVFNVDDKDPLTSNRTEEFIYSVETSLPAVKKFYLPPKEKTPANGRIEVTTPVYLDAENKEQTTIVLAQNSADGDLDGFKTRYEKIKKLVEKNSTYQRYSLKLLSDLAIKCGLISNIAYMFKKREVTASSTSPKISLAEKERNMALEGLDPAYYGTPAEPLSVAALNLKTLHAQNVTIYFMYQILRQIEYANYIQSLKSLQEQQITSMTDDQDISKIKALIEDLGQKPDPETNQKT